MIFKHYRLMHYRLMGSISSSAQVFYKISRSNEISANFMIFQARGLLVYPYCIWDGTNIMDFSSIKVTPVETMGAGKQLALATTVL